MDPKEKEYNDYCDTIGNGIKKNGMVSSFLRHLATHATEVVLDCLKGNLPPKKKLISLVNLTNICSAVSEDGKITVAECLRALDDHHEKTKNWSIGRHGEVKSPS